MTFLVYLFLLWWMRHDDLICHYFCRYSFTKAFCIAFVMTFFSVFDVPVFWPILLCYWIVLFVLTMRRQISHMIKYKYIPFNIGKQVYLMLKLPFIIYPVHLLFVLTGSPAEARFALFCISGLKDNNTLFHLIFYRSTLARNLPQAAVALAQTEALLCHDLKNTDLKVRFCEHSG